MDKPFITMIMATDRKGAIGKGNTLPWRHRGDMKSFKQLTINRTVVMGGKTFRAVGCLPKRKNIVITRDASQYADLAHKYEGWALEFVSTPEEAVKSTVDDALMVIGGSEIYKLFADQCDCVIRSKLDLEVEDADAHFLMEFPEDQWQTEMVEFPPGFEDPADVAWTLHYHYRKI